MDCQENRLPNSRSTRRPQQLGCIRAGRTYRKELKLRRPQIPAPAGPRRSSLQARDAGRRQGRWARSCAIIQSTHGGRKACACTIMVRYVSCPQENEVCVQVKVSHTGDRLRMSRRCQQSAQEPGGSLHYKYLNTHYRNTEVQEGDWICGTFPKDCASVVRACLPRCSERQVVTSCTSRFDPRHLMFGLSCTGVLAGTCRRRIPFLDRSCPRCTKRLPCSAASSR